jgi:hypothetical protein
MEAKMADAADTTALNDPRTGNFLLVMPADIAADVAMFVSREETRYYLNGFEVRRQVYKPDGARKVHNEAWFAAATDGHRLCAIRMIDVEVICNPELMPEGITSLILKLPPDVLKECRKPPRALPRKWLRVYAQGKGCDIVSAGEDVFSCLLVDRGAALVSGGTPQNVLIDGTFPDWQRVVPQGELKPAHVWFNAGLMADFGKLSRERTGGTVGIFTIDDVYLSANSNPAENAILVRVSGREDALCVLMPMRSGASKIDPRQLVFGEKWKPRKPMTGEEIEAERAKIGTATPEQTENYEAQIQE